MSGLDSEGALTFGQLRQMQATKRAEMLKVFSSARRGGGTTRSQEVRPPR